MTPAGGLVQITRRNLRRPLTLAESLTHHENDSSWPPTYIYETVESIVLQLAGIVLRDDDLRAEGKQQEQRLMRLSAAQEVRSDADQLRQEADHQLRTDHAGAEADRSRIEERSGSALDAADETAAKRKERAAQKAATAKARLAKVEQDAQKRVEQKARDETRTAIREERAALAQRKKALDAERRVEAIDDALEESKDGRLQE